MAISGKHTTGVMIFPRVHTAFKRIYVCACARARVYLRSVANALHGHVIYVYTRKRAPVKEGVWRRIEEEEEEEKRKGGGQGGFYVRASLPPNKVARSWSFERDLCAAAAASYVRYLSIYLSIHPFIGR